MIDITTKRTTGSAELPLGTATLETEALDDAALLARVRAGNERARAELVRRFRGCMFAVARRFLRTDEDSADAVQDAFVAAFRSLDRFEGGSALGTWLHRIV